LALFFAAEDFTALADVLPDVLAGFLAFFAAGLADDFALAAFVLEVVFFATLRGSVSGRLFHLRHICAFAVFFPKV
jgi:hypothetical protein